MNTSSNTGEEDADIDAGLAWDLSTGSSEVAIAVIDSGIPMQDDNGDGTYDEDDLSHPDLDDKGKIILGPDTAYPVDENYIDSSCEPTSGDGKGAPSVETNERGVLSTLGGSDAGEGLHFAYNFSLTS